MLASIEETAQDGNGCFRSAFSSAARKLSDVGRHAFAGNERNERSGGRRNSTPASFLPVRNNAGSGNSLAHPARSSHSVDQPSRGFGPFDNVTIQFLPPSPNTCNDGGALNTIRSKTSSLMSSIKSHLGYESGRSVDDLAERAKQYTDGLGLDESKWDIQIVGNKVRCTEKSSRFQIRYNAIEEAVQVICVPRSINRLKLKETAHVICNISISPGWRHKKVCLLKNGVQYQKTTATFKGVTAAELETLTLDLVVKSKKKLWKRDEILWRESVNLQDLSSRESVLVYWRK